MEFYNCLEVVVDKKGFLGILLILTGLLWLSGCGGTNQNQKSIKKPNQCEQEILRGKESLSNGSFNDALAHFQVALKENEKCNQARWGIIIAETETFISTLNALLFMNQNTLSSSFHKEGIQSMLSGILAGFENPLREIQKQIPLLEDSNTTFQIDSLPFLFGPIKTPYIKLTLQGKFTQTELELIKFLDSSLLGTIDFIWAHDFDITLSDFPTPTSNDSEFNYFFYIRDGFPNIYAKYPNFLGKGVQWNSRMPYVDDEYADAITGIYSFLQDLPNNDPTPSPENTLIIYEDTDGNGVDGGDVIGLNIKEVEKFSLPITDISTPDDNPDFYKELLSHYSIPYPFTPQFMKYLYNFLKKLYTSLNDVDKGKVGPEIHPYKLINSLIEGIGFLTIPPIPDFFAIRPAKFFINPHPIKDYLPQLIDFIGGFTTWPKAKYSFLIEAEFGKAITETDVKLFYNKDVTHFTNNFTLNGKPLKLSSIQPDCIFNPKGTIYPYWQDPSFNGFLLLNVKNLFGDNCPNDPSGWSIANNYTFNKTINGLEKALKLGNDIREISP